MEKKHYFLLYLLWRHLQFTEKIVVQNNIRQHYFKILTLCTIYFQWSRQCFIKYNKNGLSEKVGVAGFQLVKGKHHMIQVSTLFPGAHWGFFFSKSARQRNQESKFCSNRTSEFWKPNTICAEAGQRKYLRMQTEPVGMAWWYPVIFHHS